MCAQAGAEPVQMTTVGTMPDASSSVPTRTTMLVRLPLDSLNNCVPHPAQNERRMRLPLSARLSKCRGVPVTATAARGTMMFTAALPSAQYWQSRHHHRRVASGSADST